MSDRVPPVISYAARQLLRARELLGRELPGVLAWIADRDMLEAVRFRLRFPNPAADVAALLSEAANEAAGFDVLLAAPPPPPPGYVEALAAVVDLLADPATDRAQDGLLPAWADYKAALERDLVGPLRAAALRRPDLAARVAGMNLADVTAALFESGVHVQAAIAHQVIGRHGVLDPDVHKLVAAHFRQVAQFQNLLAAVSRVYGRFA
jgi:hypothetical protein